MVRTLNDGIYDPLLLRTSSPLAQVPRNRLIDLDERGLFIDDVKLMLISQLVISGPELANRLVVLIEDRSVAVAMAVSGIMIPLKGEKHISSLPAALLEVRRPD